LRTLSDEVDPDGVDHNLLTWASSIADRSGVVPDLTLARQHFAHRTAQGMPEGPMVLVRLDELERASPPALAEAEFRVALDHYKEQLLSDTMASVLMETATVLRNGVTKRQFVKGNGWQNVTVRGVEPAFETIRSGLHRLEHRLKQRTTQGDFASEMDAAVLAYERNERDPSANLGVTMGIDKIDHAHHGLKRGELALMLAFTSHLKTTFCLNWYYKAAVYQGKHVALASLETHTDVIRDLLIGLHSTHPKFGFDREVTRITFDRIRGGRLTPDEKQALADIAEDLKSCREYGRMVYKRPEEQMTVLDIFEWVNHEQQSTGEPFELLVVDYLGLVDPEKGESSFDKFANLNKAIRLAKIAALEFDHGRGIGVVSPFQASRKGFEDAEKAGGRYTLRALSGANEAERSSDFVYYLYVDDAMRGAGEVAMGNLKARQTAMVTEQFRLFADLSTRLIDNLDLSDPAQSRVQGAVL
jgi:hypothetical protein